MTHHISHPASESKSPRRVIHDLVDTDEVPDDFNLTTFPILATHWFGVSLVAAGAETVAAAV